MTTIAQRAADKTRRTAAVIHAAKAAAATQAHLAKTLLDAAEAPGCATEAAMFRAKAVEANRVAKSQSLFADTL